jgi:N-acetylglutamate synthase-like GNAT family acetyltransferase
MSEQIARLAAVQLPLVNKFYKANRARGKAKGNEQVWVTKQEQQIVAAARIADICGCDFLTGVQVAQGFDGQGIASRLITQMLNTQQKCCYTFPYNHLMQWYEKLGFVTVAVEDLPNPLQMRFDRYTRQGRDIGCMAFPGHAIT